MNSAEQEIIELREALKRLELQFSSNLDQLKSRLSVLEAQQGQQRGSETEVPLSLTDEAAESFSEVHAQRPAKETHHLDGESTDSKADPWVNATPLQPATGSGATKSDRKHRFLALKGLVVSMLLSRLGPVSELAHLVFDTYEHYRKAGKTATFLMTIFGIVALVFGFGYLLQYTFVNVFGDGVKILFGLVLATGVFAAGVYLYVKKKDQLEYASSIMATAIVLYYLCIFFAAFYYSLIPAEYAIPLFGAVTLFGLGASLFFVTRVVAVITIIGGSFTPFLVDQVDVGNLHLVMQLILSAGVVVLGFRIKWDRLIHIGFVSTLVVTQIYLYSDQSLPFMNWYLVLYFYLFCLPLLGPWKSDFATMDIQVIICNLAVFVLAPWQYPIEATAGYYFSGAVIFTLVFALYRRLSIVSELQALVVLTAAVLLAAGIFTQVEGELYGLFWGLEGLLLVFIGSKFDNRLIRWEGFVALMLGLTAGVFYLYQWFLISMSGTYPWLLLFSPGLILMTVHTINLYYSREQGRLARNGAETAAVGFFSEGISVWICVAALLATYLMFPEYVFAMAFPASLIVLWRSRRTKSRFSHDLALINLALIPVGIVVGMVDAGSLMFRTLPVYAKACLFELGILAWGLQWFYNTGPLPFFKVKFARVARQAFYLALPVLLLPRVWRSYEDWFPIALLGSAGIAILLYRIVGSRPLRIEAQCLTIISSGYSIIAIMAAIPGVYSVPEALQVLAAGFILLGGTTYLHGGLKWFSDLDQPYSTVTLTLFHYAAAAVFLICYQLTGSVMVPLLAVALTYLGYVFMSPGIRALRVQLGQYHLLAWIFCLLGLFSLFAPKQNMATLVGFGMLAVNIVGLLVLVYGRSAIARLLIDKPLAIREKFWFLHLLLFGSYIAFDQWAFDSGPGPFTTLCMVVHATTILFQTARAPWENSVQVARVLYLAVLIKIFLVDMENFSIFEKMLAFMGVGCVLLFSAYQYQKRQKPLDELATER